MDILAHALWVGAGVTLARRRWPITSATVATTVVLAALPDVLHLLPIIGWWLWGEGTLATLRAFAIAVPGQEPVVPALVELWSHHLHCIMHSAVIAGTVTLLCWALLRTLWIALLGWWSHIVIDIFTHSADYFPVPVLYPFTERGFDGLAWNTPWFLALNYVALGAAWCWLLYSNWKRR
ncbi:metal-dependent hydrolase [Rhodoferax sp.]|uniref:metal-dependent hydrolase n=1 Tax=Rhodoferax sp. TaxID=50421 RepID=UPI002774A1A5|nr:metal-dependent hydrolase [Rhodoferax sp.]